MSKTIQVPSNFYLSQEEIDAIMSEITKNHPLINTIPYTGFKPQQVEFDWSKVDKIADGNETVCSHEWASYTGLKDTFEYCKKCDLKK